MLLKIYTKGHQLIVFLVAHFRGKMYSPRFNMVDRFGKSNGLLLSRFGDNLVRRVSFVCLSCRERPWLRLVMGPSRIWVVNKIWAVAKTLPALSEFKVSILLMTNAALFLPSPNYRGVLITKKFGSRMENKPYDVFSTWKMSRTESKPVDHSLESLISEVIYFLFLSGILDVKKYFYHTAD